MPISIIFTFCCCLLFSTLAFSQVPEGLILMDPEVSPHAIVVDKKNRQLSLWQVESGSLKKIGDYPTDMGKVDGNKSKLGDHRTPEGIYFFY